MRKNRRLKRKDVETMAVWQLTILVIAFLALVLIVERPWRKVTDPKKLAVAIFVILLIILLFASALSAFLYY